MRKSYMKTLNKDWKLGAAVGTALSLGSAGAIAGPHGFDLHNVLNGASASMAGTSIAHTEDPVSAVFGNPATLAQYFGGTHFMFGATFYQPRVQWNMMDQLTAYQGPAIDYISTNR
jgi:hypothetical protein